MPFLKPADRRLFAVQCTKPMQIKGMFTTEIKFNSLQTSSEIYVSENDIDPLLSSKTSQDLGLIKVNVNLIESSSEYIISKYPKLFSGIGKLKDMQVHLHIDPKIHPVAQPHRRIPFHFREAVEKELMRLQKEDIIERVEGPTPWISPIVVVPKQHESKEIRICVDMRVANRAIKRERHPSPTVDDIIAAVNNAELFSKLDLKNGYHQLELDEESRNITTFSTHNGIWRYKRLNFGICLAAEKFQQVISELLADIENVLNISDDIFIFGPREVHNKTLEQVLARLEDKGITLNLDKCCFSKSKVIFFGYEISADGIKPDPRKIEAFSKLSPPTNPTGVRSVLGMINFAARFIPNLSAITKPLRDLTTKNVKWKWGKTEQHAFMKLKESMEKHISNSYFDTNKTSHLYVDASPEGVAAILTQSKKKDQNVIACASSCFTSTQKRYSQIEREMLAITWGVDHFKTYLLGSKFIIHTDHKPLVSLLSNHYKSTSARLERLRLKLQGQDFSICHIPGLTNPADYMSREPIKTKYPEEDVYVNAIVDWGIPATMTRNVIAVSTSKDPVLTKVCSMIKCNINNWDDPLIEPYKKIINELSITNDGIVLKNTKIVIPEELQKQVIKLGHIGHQGTSKTINLLRSKVWFPKLSESVEKFVKECIPCQAATPSNKRDPIQLSPTPRNAWDKISMDFCGPYPNGNYLMVVIDDYSRYPVIKTIKSLSAGVVIPELCNIFTDFGFPTTIKTDSGPPFNGEEFKNFLISCDIYHHRVTPAWPEANGHVERFMRTLQKAVRTMMIEKQNWNTGLQLFLMQYRATPHSTTSIAPAKALIKSAYRTIIPEMFNESVPDNFDLQLRMSDERNKNKMKENADQARGVSNHQIQEGDVVIVKTPKVNKFSTPFDPNPFTVTEVKGTAITAQRDERKITRNASFFKGIKPSQNKEDSSSEISHEEEELTEKSQKRNKKVPTWLNDYIC